jgi:hypothetical protein
LGYDFKCCIVIIQKNLNVFLEYVENIQSQKKFQIIGPKYFKAAFGSEKANSVGRANSVAFTVE